MDNNDKARRMIEAANEVQLQYQNEGKPDLAKRVADGFDGLPVGSLALLYDIITKPRS